MATAYHEMTNEELDKQLDQARVELRNLRFTFAVARSLQSPARVGDLKKNIARILTIKRGRDLGIAKVLPKSEKSAALEKKSASKAAPKKAEPAKVEKKPAEKAEAKPAAKKAAPAKAEKKPAEKKEKAKKK